jgi:hypothetical protein
MAGISSQVDTSFYTQAQPNALMSTANDAMQFANGVQQNKLLKTTNQQQQLQLFEGQMGQMYGLYTSLAAKGANLSMADIQGAGDLAIKTGLATSDQVQALTSSIPPNASPAQLQQFVQDQAARSLDAHDRVATFLGAPTQVNIGGQTIFGRQNINGFLQNGAVNNTLSPSQKAAPTPAGVTRSGTVFNAPTMGVLGQEGYDESGNPVAGTNSPAGGGASNLRTSQDPGFGTAASAPGAATPTSAPPAPQPSNFDPNAPLPNPQGGVLTQAPAGVAAQVAAASQQYAADQTDAANFQAKSLPLMKSYQALVRLGPEGTGPGKDQLNTVKSFLSAWGMPAGDVQNLQDFAEAKKYLVANLLANGDTGTNDKLAATSAANPTVDINNAAGQDIVATAIAQQRISAARSRMAQAQGIDPSQYPSWVANQFTPNLDARAYEFDLLSPKAKSALISGMSDQQFAKFQEQLVDAQKYGYVTAPQQAGSASNGQ